MYFSGKGKAHLVEIVSQLNGLFVYISQDTRLSLTRIEFIDRCMLHYLVSPNEPPHQEPLKCNAKEQKCGRL